MLIFCHLKKIVLLNVIMLMVRYFEKKKNLSLVTRKPVFGLCDQVRLNPACSATETS